MADPTAHDLAASPSPDAGDPVLHHLAEAAGAYREERREMQGELEEVRGELQESRGDLDEARELLRALDAELNHAHDEARRAREDAERQLRRAEHMHAAIRQIHRSLFAGNVYELILKACLTITHATRGLYVTWRGDRDEPRVRAAVDVGEYPGAPVSPYVRALCRRVLDENRAIVCNAAGDLGPLPEPEESERFRNCVISPVVLLKNLDGILIAADKDGEFEQADIDSLLSVGSQAAVAVENRHLERELQSAYVSTVTMLADAVEAKDPYTHGHCEMASRYARLIAGRMELEPYEQSLVCYSALLHDVGKIGVSDGVLNKPGPLLPEERDLMRAHVRVGHDLLSTIPALRSVAQVVLHHHEWYDGSGYPDGLAGDAIPVAARIVAAVDAYCAMVTRRSYKEAYTEDHARSELRKFAGTQFDPQIVDIFLQVLDTPAASDQDDDDYAECGLLPGFANIHDLREALP
jgi:HD-GYP domain-containing protein (c-di-GMP phosphodiesterase class II)